MRKLTIALCMLLLAGCTAKEVLVTKPVNIEVKIDEVKGTKVILTITSDNRDAWYTYAFVNSYWEGYSLPNEEAARSILSLADESYNIKRGNSNLFISSFAEMTCLRGTRTIRVTGLSPDIDYKLLVFQVHPTTHELIGKVFVDYVHTKPVNITPMDFQFVYDGKVITVIPSDQDRTYYWEYDNQAFIYDNFNWAYGWYYGLIDMYEQYGFMDHLTSRGTDVYDAGRDSFLEGEICTVVAAAYEDGETTSEAVEQTFICRNGRLEPLGDAE